MTIQAGALKAIPTGILSVNFGNAVRLILISAGLALFASLAVYIFQVNSLVGMDSAAQKMEAGISDLARGNQELELSLVSANAMEKVLPEIDRLGFEKTGRISYIKLTDGKVVINTIKNAE